MFITGLTTARNRNGLTKKILIGLDAIFTACQYFRLFEGAERKRPGCGVGVGSMEIGTGTRVLARIASQVVTAYVRIIWRHGSASILGTTRTDCYPCPHANVLGWLVPNSFPTGKKAEIRPWIGLTSGV